jgi:hypothetical protein
MGLLKSVDNVPGINYIEFRERNYWDKFKYRARLTVPGARYTHNLKSVDDWLKRAKNFRHIRHEMLDSKTILENTPIIEKFLKFKRKVKASKEIIVRVEGDVIAIFSNDLSELHNLQSWGNIDIDFTEIQITKTQISPSGHFAGVKYFVRKPKRQYRVYLTSKRVDVKVMEELVDLFKRSKQFYPSPGLTSWLEFRHKSTVYRGRYCSSAYFIEYDEESYITLLALTHGELLGRRFKLEKRPDTTE